LRKGYVHIVHSAIWAQNESFVVVVKRQLKFKWEFHYGCWINVSFRQYIGGFVLNRTWGFNFWGRSRFFYKILWAQYGFDLSSEASKLDSISTSTGVVFTLDWLIILYESREIEKSDGHNRSLCPFFSIYLLIYRFEVWFFFSWASVSWWFSYPEVCGVNNFTKHEMRERKSDSFFVHVMSSWQDWFRFILYDYQYSIDVFV
jgi:hypothetical protein